MTSRVLSRSSFQKLLLLLALVLSACAHDSEARKKELLAGELRVRDFYPMRLGSSWTYEMRMGHVVEEQKIELVAMEHGYFKDNLGGLLRVDSEGLRDPRRYMLRAPLIEGNEWSAVLEPGVIEYFSIEEVGTSCSAPAGVFGRCIRVRGMVSVGGGRNLLSQWTYAEGVGLVEFRSWSEKEEGENMQQIEMKLLSFERGP